MFDQSQSKLAKTDTTEPTMSEDVLRAPSHQGTERKLERIHANMHDVVTKWGEPHPLSHGVTPENLESLLRNYFAMSQAFPLIQAGACKDLIFQSMAEGSDIGPEIEMTTVVGAFLTWDETGGYYLSLGRGRDSLPEILETDKYFHSNLLRADLKRIGNIDPRPSYSVATIDYLKQLSADLSSADHVHRCAAMVAFEMHAESMISALWGSLSEIVNIPKDELVYFKVHVGGDDPAEEYHKQMTQKMIACLVPTDREQDYCRSFENCYKLHTDWCQAIKVI